VQVQMTMRVAGAGGDPGPPRLRSRPLALYLPTPWTNPRRGVLGQPADDLSSSIFLSSVVCRRDLRVV
jgi:hypothetical protein